MAVLHMLQPTLAGSKGFGCPNTLSGLSIPCRRGALGQLLGSVYQACGKIWHPVLHSLLSSNSLPLRKFCITFI